MDRSKKRSKTSKGSSSRSGPPAAPRAEDCPFRLANNDERTRYNHLRLLPVVPFRRFPVDLSREHRQEVRDFLRVAGWDSFINGEISYRTLMLEFYTSLRFEAGDDLTGTSMSFRLFDVEYTLSERQLDDLLGIMNRGWILLEMYNNNEAWAELRTVSPNGGDNEFYYRSRFAKTSSLTLPSHQRLHKFVIANYGGRFELNRFSGSDLVILHRIHHGRTVSLASYIFATLPGFVNRPALTWGAFITIIAKRLTGLNELPADRLGDEHPPIHFTDRQFAVHYHAPHPAEGEEGGEDEEEGDDQAQAQPQHLYGPGFDAIINRLDTMSQRIEQIHLESNERFDRFERRMDNLYQRNGWPIPNTDDDSDSPTF